MNNPPVVQTIQAVPQHVVAYPQANVAQVATFPEGPHPASRNKTGFMVIGVIEITLGVVCFILGAVAFAPLGQVYAWYPGYGIWSGILYNICGVLAISTAKNANTGNVIAGLVVSIIASVNAFIVGILEALGAAILAYIGITEPPYNIHAGLRGAVACLSFAAFITVIVHSALCCAGQCGVVNRQGSVVTTTTAYATSVPTAQIPMQPVYNQAIYPAQPQWQMSPNASTGPQQTKQQPAVYHAVA